MKKTKLAFDPRVGKIAELARKTDKKILVIWAIDCVERVLNYFENKYQEDNRPRLAIEAAKNWVKTGVFSMFVIRKASLDSHTAARKVIDDAVARSVARAAGQAVATTHVKDHALAAAVYAVTAIRDIKDNNIEAMEKEREWQYEHLVKLRKLA